MPFPDSFTTARLVAERLTRDHFDEVLRMHRDPEVMASLGGIRDEQQTETYFVKNLKHWDEYGFGLWIVRQRREDEIAGRAVLRHLIVDGVDEIEVGYAFYAAYWGRGLATELAIACVAFGKNELGWSTIVGVTSPTNFKSQRVLQKAGLAYEREFMHEGHVASLFRTT